MKTFERLILRNILCIIAGVMIAAIWSGDAQARHHGGQAVIVGPILQDSDINIGNQTRTNKGGTLLHSVDITTTAVVPFTFKGVDIRAGGTTPVSYTTICLSGTIRTCSDFTATAADQLAATALTPQPSSTGQGNLSGNYLFSVTAKDVNGNVSAAKTLTLHAVNPTGGGCVSIGQNDSSGLIPAGFGTSPNQCVLFSTGFNKMASRYILNIANTFTNEVIITQADITKPAAFSNFEISTMSHVTVQDIVVSGDLLGPAPTCIMCSGTSGAFYSDTKFVRVFGYFSNPMIGNNSAQGPGFWSSGSCTSGCGIFDSGADYVNTGISNTTNSIVSNMWLGHIYNNCVFLGPSSGVKLLNFTTCFAPMTEAGGAHTDTQQNADGASVSNEVANNFWALQAGGSDQAQGFLFGGGPINATVYVDDGLGSHGPGKVATLVTGSFQTNSNGSQVYSTSGSPLAISDNITMTCAGSNCTGKTQATLSLASNVNIGSPASPVPLLSVSELNLTADGIVNTTATFHGMDTTSEQGTGSVKHFSYVQQNANPAATMTFQGQFISSTVLDVSTTPTSNIPDMVPFLLNSGRLSYSVCIYCGPQITGFLSGVQNGIGHYSVSPSVSTTGVITMQASPAYPIVGGAQFLQINCSVALHGGTFLIDRGYAQGGITICGAPVTSTTLTHTVNPVAADYLSGVLPETALEAISGAAWDAISPAVLHDGGAALRARVCNIELPKVGGALDVGDGTYIGSFTPTGEIQLDSGNVAVVGCGVH